MLLSRITRALAGMIGGNAQRPSEMSEYQLVEMLESYYFGNGVYLKLCQALREQGLWSPSMKDLRNPVHSAVEFYAMTLWPGPLPAALPIDAQKPAIVPLIQQIHTWSNFGTKKQLCARQFALTGDMFLKVEMSTDRKRVYIKPVSGKCITDFDTDERGYITWLRYECAKVRRNAEGEASTYMHTEIWRKDAATGHVVYDLYEHDKGQGASTTQMGAPVKSLDITQDAVDINFLPWVHAPFKDIDDKRGMPLVWPVLSKIDEVNQKTTRLSEMLFLWNKAYMFLSANATDANGRPMPAPGLNLQGTRKEVTDRLAFGDMELYALPGNATLQFAVPNINWQAHMDAIKGDLEEIERDMPEIAYYNVIKDSGLSGRALQLKMGPVIQRVIEARGNAETALVRAHEMALTIGQLIGIPEFKSIGTYEAGDFAHRIKTRDVIPMSDADRADLTKVYKDMGVPLDQALVRYSNWTQEDANAALNDSATQLTNEQAVQAQEAAVARATQQIVPMVERALTVIQDGAIEKLVSSGAIDALVKAKAAAGNGKTEAKV